MHNQIVLPQGQDIVDVTVGEVGKQVTLICFENTKINLAKKFLGDKAYKGEAAIITPQKKPKNGEITETQKNKKIKLSSSRIGVEHVIGLVKIFRVASERFCLKRSQ